ncbi:piggyBac transposable element-derived protein 3-like [Ischnura elegans]|uniref:piggyBac transposable element-derived protein 3-like n=1 Tax=Ischnura elegans TaxID=197161 RepID=UPI001ED8A14B|nr:piggyBac transposable element-derived protein 3-like [Ischnura elegans]
MSRKRTHCTAEDIVLLLDANLSEIEDESSEDEVDCIISERRDTAESLPCMENQLLIEVKSGSGNVENEECEESSPRSEEDRPFLQGPLLERGGRVMWEKSELKFLVPENDEIFIEYSHEEMTPINYFKLFCDDRMISDMSKQTNLYSVQKTGSSLNTNSVEMEQFLGINLLSGIVKMPSYRMYWASKTRYSPIADIMPRNRFDKLRNFFHLNDNSTFIDNRQNPAYDKLYKVRPFLDSLLQNMKKIEMEKTLAVDEILVPFKGHSSLKQYIKNKPHKWGIKIFALAGVSGIVYNFKVYVGKGTIASTSKLGVSGDIVLELLNTVPKNKNFKIFFDNWFSSYHLMLALKNYGFLAVGTAKVCRLAGCQFETEKELKKAGRGSYDCRSDIKNKITAIKWYDNRSVHVISNYIGVEPIGKAKRWSQEQKSQIEIPIPAAIQQYNANMGGVDLNDMLVSLYRTNIKVKRFYLRIFFHLLDLSVVNAWLLYRRHNKQKQEKGMTLVEFKADICNALLQAGKLVSPKRGRPSSHGNDKVPNAKRKCSVTPNDDMRTTPGL